MKGTYDNYSSVTKGQEGQALIVNMRRKHNEATSPKGNHNFVVLMAASCLISFNFRAELTSFAGHLHKFYNGTQSAAIDGKKTAEGASKSLSLRS